MPRSNSVRDHARRVLQQALELLDTDATVEEVVKAAISDLRPLRGAYAEVIAAVDRLSPGDSYVFPTPGLVNPIKYRRSLKQALTTAGYSVEVVRTHMGQKIRVTALKGG